MAVAAILNFRNVKYLTVGTVKRVELRHHAKFCGDRSNCRQWPRMPRVTLQCGRIDNGILRCRDGTTM